MDETINLQIHNIHGIIEYTQSFNLEPGIYAITGLNASGKSTIMAALAALFYRSLPNRYFINVKNGSGIRYEYNNIQYSINYRQGRWERDGQKLGISGFYEGSLIFGNRFRDTNYRKLVDAKYVPYDELIPADEYVWKELGNIMYNNEDAYRDKLYRITAKRAERIYRYKGSPYFVQTAEGEYISQLSMSTGESLLISLLHSLYFQVVRKDINRKFIVLLDEVEMALHPSALVRFLQRINYLTNKTEPNLVVYFATHSIELIRRIRPYNIYYIKRYPNRSYNTINPAWPAYVTKTIYEHDGYDLVILVEDNLTKKLIERIILNRRMSDNKVIKVLPAGGWHNVLELHRELYTNQVIRNRQKIVSILDEDVKKQYNAYISKDDKKKKYGHLFTLFAPVESVEKYLYKNIILELDTELYETLSTYVFKQNEISEIAEAKYIKEDKTGKLFWNALEKKLSKYDLTIDIVIEIIINHISKVEPKKIEQIAQKIERHIKTMDQ